MAKIAEIKKLIETKTKTYANAEDSVKKEQGIIDAMEKQLALLKKTKAPKDTMKQTEKEIENSEKKKAQIQKGMEENMKALEALNERLVQTTEFTESREGFLKWWEKEEAKMADLVDKIRDEAAEAESQSVAAEKAVSSGDVAGARKAAGLARAAADKAGTLADQAHKTYSGWGPTLGEQRNYKTSDMEKGDVDSYADLTKKVYESFKTGDSLIQSADRHKASADRSVGTAEEFAESGGDLAKAYRKVLTEAHAGMTDVLDKLESGMTTKWGKVIEERGQAFAKFLNQYQSNPETFGIPARKAAEQGEPLCAASVQNSKKILQVLELQRTKALARIPKDQQVALRDDMKPMTDVLVKARKLVKEQDENYAATLVELNKLKQAVG